MPPSHAARTEALREIREAYDDLIELIGGITDERLALPGTAGIWSGRDVIVHIADWEAVLTEHLGRLDAGQPPDWPTAARDNDSVNADMLRASEGKTLSEVMTYLHETHERLMATLETSPSVELQHALDVTKGHYQRHRADLVRAKGSHP